jgi:polysaccharide deacetylase family protein (PEP-CTERM system associated)
MGTRSDLAEIPAQEREGRRMNIESVRAGPPKRVAHIFTVDVEEWFQVSALEGVVSRESWALQPARVEAPVDRLLELLAAAGSTGTFFVLGWLADRNPALVRRIADAGHEIASHGWWHRRVFTMQPDEFRADVSRSRARLEEICGRAVIGFRAPSFSMVPGCEWAFDILLEEGYRYDSSIFPIRRSRQYGYPNAPHHPYLLRRRAGDLFELPLTPARLAGIRVPAAGGAYFRHFPYALTRRALNQSAAQRHSGVFYIHPWELDETQPVLSVPTLTRWRHYGNLRRTEPRLRRLLKEFRFVSAARALDLPQQLHTHAGSEQAL